MRSQLKNKSRLERTRKGKEKGQTVKPGLGSGKRLVVWLLPLHTRETEAHGAQAEAKEGSSSWDRETGRPLPLIGCFPHETHISDSQWERHTARLSPGRLRELENPEARRMDKYRQPFRRGKGR